MIKGGLISLGTLHSYPLPVLGASCQRYRQTCLKTLFFQCFPTIDR